MKRIAKELVERWHATLEKDNEEFLDFAEHIDINSFVVENGVRKVLFENGNTYSVDREMAETDGDMEQEIIETLVECGVDFREGYITTEEYKKLEKECL